MKKGTFITILLLFVFFTFPGYSQQAETEIPPQTQEEELKPQPTPPPPFNLGRVYFPRDFVHANKDYKKGTYRVKLVEKDHVPYFEVSNRKGDLLFEEMAVVKTYKSKSKRFRPRVRKEMLRGYEFFRIKVTKPGEYIMAYFLIKQKEKPAEKTEEQPEKKDDN